MKLTSIEKRNNYFANCTFSNPCLMGLCLHLATYDTTVWCLATHETTVRCPATHETTVWYFATHETTMWCLATYENTIW